jgi:hypothetical protein
MGGSAQEGSSDPTILRLFNRSRPLFVVVEHVAVVLKRGTLTWQTKI